ncbi:MAG TPA: hypothetical protein VMB82_08335, partial [Acidimicrobiales bacterium]|nr:hypothetical protein [Acidimicrobiales bacterium]
MRSKWGLPVIIAIGFVFLLGSALAVVELGTSKTVCRSARLTTFHRITGPVCTTSGGTSPVVYVILVVAMIIGVICLAAGITVLAVRISAPEPSGGSRQVGQSYGYGGGPTASGPAVAGGLAAQGSPAETAATFDPGVGGTAEAGSLPPFSGAQDTGGAAAGSPPPGWYEVAPGGPKRWWD